MPGKVLISTAYLPPLDYFRLIVNSDEILIEAKENFHKQSYRNRCYILSSHGSQLLSVPVIEGSRHKIPVTEARIDYSKRWQQVHLRAIVSSYRCSPYFEFFYEPIEKIISAKHELLWDLNSELMKAVMQMMKLKIRVSLTTDFEIPSGASYDFRYRLDPAKHALFNYDSYLQVFSSRMSFVPNLSIIDLIFNIGPDSAGYLKM